MGNHGEYHEEWRGITGNRKESWGILREIAGNRGESRGIMGNREESRGISLGVTGNIGESRGMLRNYGEYRRESWGIPWNIAGNRGERGVITWKIEDTSSFPRIKA